MLVSDVAVGVGTPAISLPLSGHRICWREPTPDPTRCRGRLEGCVRAVVSCVLVSGSVFLFGLHIRSPDLPVPVGVGRVTVIYPPLPGPSRALPRIYEAAATFLSPGTNPERQRSPYTAWVRLLAHALCLERMTRGNPPWFGSDRLPRLYTSLPYALALTGRFPLVVFHTTTPTRSDDCPLQYRPGGKSPTARRVRCGPATGHGLGRLIQPSAEAPPMACRAYVRPRYPL